MPQIYELLARHKYTFSDQDVLNMLFDGRVLPLDIRWNYMTCVAEQLQSGNRYSEELYADLRREDPAVIHYVGHRKPWNADKILSEHYEYIIVGSWKNSKRSSKYLLFFYKKCRKIIYVLVKVAGIFYNNDGEAEKNSEFTIYKKWKVRR